MATKLITGRPLEPTEDNAVVRWSKWEGGYSYASIKTPNGMWYTTQDPDRFGNQRIFPADWDDLLGIVGEKNWASMELLS